MNRTSLVAFLALIALPALPSPAFAHAHLQGTKPASGATVSVAPSQLVLTFSESPALAMSALRLFGPDSTPVALGAVTHDAGVRTLTARITGPLVAGRYTVEWQTAGDDGHVQHGSYQFVIAEGAAGFAPATAMRSDTLRRGSASLPDVSILDSAVGPTSHTGFDASSPLYVLIRWVQFAALLLVIGAVAFRWLILPRAGAGLSEPAVLALMLGAARAGSWGAWLLAEAAVARLVAQAATLHGAGYMTDRAVIVPMLTSTIWGHAWILQIVAAIIAIVALRMVRRDATSTPAWSIAALAAIALAIVPALSGHAIATRQQAPIAVTADTFHVLGAGAWLGTLAVMLIAGLPIMARESAEGRTGALSRMVNAFSPLALGCAAVVVFTGVIAARYHLGSWGAFTNTTYGKTLLVKLAIVVLLVCVAAYNWRRVRPSLVLGADSDVRRIRSSASAEVILALLIVLVTAVLVALPTPMDVVV
jgi:putative copper export protein/methionine-rich copper-binding protein CopC